ncbi:SGNH/GDSL hydrolase family protein [Ferruginibacter sp. SUN002]|uniref:SGNH/GDSL hydrolase family protein n=1 Tax=Ferruginibacter sp. SUN002 TaxID=2937789 RepID=UPI003D3611BA
MSALFSCEKENTAVPPVITEDTTVVIKPKDTIRSYLALGDSYTIGQSVLEEDRFPVQTVRLLITDSIKFSSEIIAQTGWTTTNLLNRINSKPPLKSSYDIVTLLIGVNNQYQGLSQDQYRTEFTTLLNKSIVFAGNKTNRVIVLSIPDYSVTPFADGYNISKIAAEIDSFNVINKEITLAAGVTYLDITSSTRLAENDDSLIAYDGLHPSGKEYAKWAIWLAPMIKDALKN